MAVLGVQLVFSMVTASFLSKISPRMSFARWLLCGRLVRYLHPTNEELKTMAGMPNAPPGKKGRKKEESKGKAEDFSVPKTISIQLEASQVQSLDVLPLKFYTEFQWLIDFALCSIFIYVITELYYSVLKPKEEFNLSMVWCIVVLGFALKILFSLTAIYFRTEEGGERILCIVFGFFFLVFSMGILIVDDDTLEFGLEKAYQNFSIEAKTFLDHQGMQTTGPASLLTCRIILAIFCAILGSFMTFPGLRLAKMHHDALKYSEASPFKTLLLHTNMLFPMFISLMWLKPVMREYLVRRDYSGRKIIVDDESFDTIRIIVILVFCLFRFTLLTSYLQSHLNTAVDRVAAIRKEAGRIKAKDLQHMVTSVYYYLCVVALQYLAPLVLLAYSALMMKTLGEFSIASTFGFEIPSLNLTSKATAHTDTVTETAAQFTLALSNLRLLFTPLLFRGLMSFFCWWIATTWFITSAFGLVYYGYFHD